MHSNIKIIGLDGMGANVLISMKKNGVIADSLLIDSDCPDFINQHLDTYEPIDSLDFGEIGSADLLVDVPIRLKITIIGALLYLILPADVIPDAIPGVGLIDDVGVLLAVYNELSKFLVPKVIERAKVKLQESYYEKIDLMLKEIFYLMLLSSVITFVINMIGIAILIIKPAGENSRFIALGIFSITVIYTFVRVFYYFKQYGKVTLGVAKYVMQEKSLSKGVSLFVQETYPSITKIYAE